MSALLMRSEKTGAAWRVWPEPEPVSLGTVQETGSYFFELHGTADAVHADLLIDDLPLEALRTQAPDTARWRWSPGFPRRHRRGRITDARSVAAALRGCYRSGPSQTHTR